LFGTFISEPFDVVIVGGNAKLRYACGDQTIVPVRVLREMVARAQAALAEHDALPDNVVSVCGTCVQKPRIYVVRGEEL
jgi:pyruvate/2-oxoglutarate/acetoin dehydrogenase E1 component